MKIPFILMNNISIAVAKFRILRSSLSVGYGIRVGVHRTAIVKCLFWGGVVVVLFFGAYLRVAFSNIDRAIVQGDEYTYYNAAESIIEHGYMVRNPFAERQDRALYTNPTAALSPGYPVFIAIIYSIAGHSVSAVFFMQIAISIAMLVLILLILIELEIRKDAIILCLCLSAFYPGFLYNNDRMLTEHLFTFLIFSFAAVFIKTLQSGSMWLTFLAAILMACAIHTRAQAIPFSILAVVFLMIYGRYNAKRRAVQALLFVVCIIIAMIPYWLHNYETLGRVLLLPETGEGPMIWGAVPYFLDMPSTTNVPLAEVISVNSTPAPAIYWKWRIFGFLHQMWGDVWDENQVHAQPFLRPWLLLQHFLIIPTIAAIPLLARHGDPRIIFVAAFPLAITYMSIPFHGLPRYAFPSIPFVMIIFAVLLGNVLNRIQSCTRLPAPMVDRSDGFGDRIIRLGLLTTSALQVVTLLFSVYLFSWNIHKEMSAYRLARYLGTTPIAVSNSRPIASFVFGAEQLAVGNALKKEEGVYEKNIDGTALINILVPAAPINADGPVASKVVLNISGGFIYDFMTVYWISKKVKVFSESHVYPRFPINFMEDSQVIFVDDDVTELLIVPSGFRGGSVYVKSIVVTKYAVDNLMR